MSPQQTPPLSLVALPEYSPTVLLAGSLVVALLAIIFAVYVARSKSSSRNNIILLLGNEDAGKSAVHSTIVYEHSLPTHTSFQVNSSLVPETFLSKKQLQVVDVPGHPRLRDSFKTYIGNAKAIIFVVDASTITRNGREVAEHLHQVLHALTSLPPTHALPPLLILAHKTDLLPSGSSSTLDRSSLAISRVRTVLERELEKRRSAAAGGVGVEGLGEEGEDNSADMGGLECGSSSVFRFAEWEGGEVDFAATYVKVGESSGEKAEEEKLSHSFSGLDSLRDWIEELS